MIKIKKRSGRILTYAAASLAEAAFREAALRGEHVALMTDDGKIVAVTPHRRLRRKR
jgi:hypothetical protein